MAMVLVLLRQIISHRRKVIVQKTLSRQLSFCFGSLFVQLLSYLISLMLSNYSDGFEIPSTHDSRLPLHINVSQAVYKSVATPSSHDYLSPLLQFYCVPLLCEFSSSSSQIITGTL